MHIYKTLLQESSQVVKTLKQKSRILSSFRLLAVLVMIYTFYVFLKDRNEVFGYVSLTCLFLFLILLSSYQKVSRKLKYQQTLVDINSKEINFLENGTNDFDSGLEFQKSNHPYAYDLDIFGNASIFKFINRTASFVGKSFLSKLFLEESKPNAILDRQEAILELRDEVAWRQKINALTILSQDSEEDLKQIDNWVNSDSTNVSLFKRILLYVVPILFLVTVTAYFITSDVILGKIAGFAFTLNLLLFSINTKLINQQIGGSDKIGATIANYAGIIAEIENKKFVSKKLINIQKQLNSDSVKISQQLNQLSNLFEKLHTIGNLFILILFNGTFQYHNHVLIRTINWKKNNASKILTWFNIVGEIEALNSLANFAYNNKSYIFPEINNSKKIAFSNLGHPLISENKRVCNSLDFKKNRFVILTGSNMSGKSTFLRTVGVNLVLANTGAPICATEATFQPMPIWVSMRLTDSLNDSESFFFAEVKRLKTIMENAKEQPVFILLDEILKGTNSDDKKSGTIGVIEKIIQTEATGIIATHDLEVCNITEKHNEILINKRFEVEIINDDLHFDYKIRDGVCENRNATFIMKKMEII